MNSGLYTHDCQMCLIHFKLRFCQERNMGYNLRKNDMQGLVPNFSRTNGLKYSFLTVLLMNGTVYLIILENQIVLKLLKIMF